MTLGKRIAELRLRAGFRNQVELAAKAGIGAQTIKDLEAGRNTNPKIDTLRVIADTLGVSLVEIIGEDPSGKVTLIGGSRPTYNPANQGVYDLRTERVLKVEEWVRLQAVFDIVTEIVHGDGKAISDELKRKLKLVSR